MPAACAASGQHMCSSAQAPCCTGCCYFEHAIQAQTLFSFRHVTCRPLQDESPSALDLPSMYMNAAYLDSLEEPLPAELPEVDDTMSLGDVSVGEAPDMERLGPSESSDSVF